MVVGSRDVVGFAVVYAVGSLMGYLVELLVGTLNVEAAGFAVGVCYGVGSRWAGWYSSGVRCRELGENRSNWQSRSWTGWQLVAVVRAVKFLVGLAVGRPVIRAVGYAVGFSVGSFVGFVVRWKSAAWMRRHKVCGGV